MKQIFVTMMASIVLFGMECLWGASCFAGQVVGESVTIRDLYCEYTKNPLGIDTPAPRFSWILESTQRGQMQSAFRILVASSGEKLDKDTGDKWDSSKVFSEKSVNVSYEGQPLTSGEKCYWKVRVWDKEGQPSTWSKAATFEMGLLKESDWQGKWISMRYESNINYVPGKLGQAINFDGHSEGIKVPHYSALKPAFMTLTAWIRQDKYTTKWQNIIRKEDNGPKGGIYFLEIGEEGPNNGVYFGGVIDGAFIYLGADVDSQVLKSISTAKSLQAGKLKASSLPREPVTSKLPITIRSGLMEALTMYVFTTGHCQQAK